MSETLTGEVVQEIESTGGKALTVCADSGDAEAIKNAISKTVQTFGRLDIW